MWTCVRYLSEGWKLCGISGYVLPNPLLDSSRSRNKGNPRETDG